jgi:hypothetical protein
MYRYARGYDKELEKLLLYKSWYIKVGDIRNESINTEKIVKY